MQSEIYIEAGDHETLLRLGRSQFARLTANALRGRINAHDWHGMMAEHLSARAD